MKNNYICVSHHIDIIGFTVLKSYLEVKKSPKTKGDTVRNMMRLFFLVAGVQIVCTLAATADQLRFNEFRRIMTHNATSLRNEATGLGNTLRSFINNIPLLPKSTKNKLNDMVQSTTLQDPNIVADQDRGVGQQLVDGVRAFKLPLHWRTSHSTFYACHTIAHSELQSHYNEIDAKVKTYLPIKKVREGLLKPFRSFSDDPCTLDRTNRPLIDVLTEINGWLDKNPNETLMIYFDSQLTGAEEQKHKDDIKKVLEQSGLFGKMYVHTSGQPWPTIGSMVKDNKRIVIVTNTDYWKDVGIFHKRDLGFGSGYNYTTDEALLKDTRNPKMDYGTVGPNKILTIDSYVTPRASGNIQSAKKVNKYDELKLRVQNYERLAGFPATYIMIDFYEVPDLDAIRLVADLNRDFPAKPAV